jgi:hypothetical protein
MLASIAGEKKKSDKVEDPTVQILEKMNYDSNKV